MGRTLKLRLTDRAEGDLAAIWAHVATEGSEASATRLLARIEAAFQKLTTFPLAGSAREQIGPGMRVTFHGNYAAYYIFDATAVTIIRVLHGARDAAALAEAGGFEAPSWMEGNRS